MNKTTLVGRTALVAILSWYTIRYVVFKVPYTSFDSIDLMFHEAGHVVFGFFGEFIAMFGGTLMQLIVPALIIGYFWKQRDQFSLLFGAWWFGQSLINVGYYMADANAQLLPLVGGGRHDWYYLLGEIHLLPHAITLGTITFVCGAVVMIIALLLMARIIVTNKILISDN